MQKSNNQPEMSQNKMGFWSVVSVGIGGMVGGGIFAVLGLSVQLAQGGAPLAFAIAGIIALLTTYSYAQLSVAFPSRGGTVMFLNKAYGTGLFTGGMNVLLWLSYIVMLSLYASAFGSYGATFFPPSVQELAKHGLISGIILAVSALNLLSPVWSVGILICGWGFGEGVFGIWGRIVLDS